jgi:hypothetical protein
MYEKIQDRNGKWAFKPFKTLGLIYPGVVRYVVLDRETGLTAIASRARLKKTLNPEEFQRLVQEVEMMGEYQDNLFHVRIHEQLSLGEDDVETSSDTCEA